MKYSLFLGCTIPARSRNYELSSRAVAEKLGLNLVDIPGFACCGFPMKASKQDAAKLLAARNLAMAEELDMGICTLCSACTSMLAEVSFHLEHDPKQRDEVNRKLAKIGRKYNGNVKVTHFSRVLLEDIGPDKISDSVEVDLKGMRVAVHYGCHYLKPSNIYPEAENPEIPSSLDLLLEAAGVESVAYERKMDCCGGAVLVGDEKTALTLAREKLSHVRTAGADAMCVVCPFCSVMYDDNQKSIESQFEEEYGIPVLFLPQIIGLAMGLGRKELGLNMNVVKTKKLTEGILE
ncbi:CoB--CoM heterodisulfide reductase iron-sulfur subunit B family protein [Thermodesulfobacteriota bacterium]